MLIDYCSDLHLDFYTKDSSTNKMSRLFNKLIEPKGEVLIVAGDISHYNFQSAMFLQVAKKHYKKVFVVTGNHDLYNISKSMLRKHTTLYSRFKELKELCGEIKGVHLLDGDAIKYNGIKFGGAMGWYDGSYYNKLTNGMYTESALSCWKNFTNDANLIPELTDYMELFKVEILKVEKAILQQPDIMITHFSPISEAISFNKVYRNDKSSGFYAFDGIRFIYPEFNTNPPKVWVHGHCHDEKEFEVYNTKFLRSPLGYPKENTNFKIKTFEI